MLKYLFFGRCKVKKGTGNYHIPSQGQYMLIFLTRPTPEEVNRVTRDFKIDPEPLQSYFKETHSRRYIAKPFQFVMRATFAENGGIGFTNLLFILTNRVLIVSSAKPTDFYDEIFEDVGETFSKTPVRSVGHILYNFLQEDVDENYDVLGLLEKQIKDVEVRASKMKLKESRLRVEDILTLKHKLFRLSRQFWATTRVLSLIRLGVAQVYIDKESARLLGDVHETFLHQIDLAAAQKEMVSDALNVYSTTISNISAYTANELNVVVKKLSAYASLLLVPTLLASIYGMNVSHLPFATGEHSFLILMGLMLAATAPIMVYFLKNDWL